MLRWVRLVIFDGQDPPSWKPFGDASMAGLHEFVKKGCRPPKSIDGHDVDYRIDYMMLPVQEALKEEGFTSVIGLVMEVGALLSEEGDLKLKQKALLNDLIARVSGEANKALYQIYGFRIWAIVPDTQEDRFVGLCREIAVDVVMALGVRPSEVQFQRVSSQEIFLQLNQTLLDEVAIKTRFMKLEFN
jgi:hypothetical protein